MASNPIQRSSMSKFFDTIQPFWIGGFSGMFATCIIQPLDMIKVLIQLKSEKGEAATIANAIHDVMSKDGFRGFYRGLDSAVTRQLFYATTRLGLYKTLTTTIGEKNKAQGQRTSFDMQRLYLSSRRPIAVLFSGFIGALVGNPPDLALVRMQADNQLPVEERRNYKNVFNAFSRITKEEGIAGLWRGSTPTIARAVVINLAMLASYDEIKERILPYFDNKETTQVRVIGSLGSGVISAFVSLPFDNAKVKLQKMKPDAEGKLPYKNIFDAMGKTISREGFTRLWVGLFTYSIRVCPHIVISLLVQDSLTEVVKKWRKGAH